MKRFAGEPPLDEILSDPVVLSLMKADGIDPSHLRSVVAKAATAATLRNTGVSDPCRQGAAVTDRLRNS